MIDQLLLKRLWALSDQTRFRAVQGLPSEGGPTITASTIGNILGVQAGTMSKHLRILENCGLLKCKRMGIYKQYTVDYKELQQVIEQLQHLIPSKETTNDL